MIKPRIQQINEVGKKGIITAYIEFYDDATNEVRKKKCFQGKTVGEIKQQVKEYIVLTKGKEAVKQSVSAEVGQALLEIESELNET